MPISSIQSSSIQRCSSISLVVSMFNARVDTLMAVDKLLFPSVLQNSSSELQFILVDDCSPLRSETEALVDRYAANLVRRCGSFEYVRNSSNLGFSGAYNAGLERASGTTLIVANDDVYFPKDSLRALAYSLDAVEDSGAAGPVTNFAYSPQNTPLFGRLKDYSANEVDRTEQFANWLRRTMSGTTYEVDLLVGFCLALPKAVLDETGAFDVRFGSGNFEDVDLIRRIRECGYKVILDAATFVQHGGPRGGSLSAPRSSVARKLNFLKNTLLYARKWDGLEAAMHHVKQGQEYLLGSGAFTDAIIRAAHDKSLWDEYVDNLRRD